MTVIRASRSLSWTTSFARNEIQDDELLYIKRVLLCLRYRCDYPAQTLVLSTSVLEQIQTSICLLKYNRQAHATWHRIGNNLSENLDVTKPAQLEKFCESKTTPRSRLKFDLSYHAKPVQRGKPQCSIVNRKGARKKGGQKEFLRHKWTCAMMSELTSSSCRSCLSY